MTLPDLSNYKIVIGLDDTDNLTSRGTGYLARMIATELASDYYVQGVTRHQLLIDPRVPCTKNNSSAAIHLLVEKPYNLQTLLERVRTLMLGNFQPGSDPGLCVATEENALSLTNFGRRSQCDLVTQGEARSLAASQSVLLIGLGGNQDGVIGALAAAGLAASGEDGRYILTGRLRQLQGLQPISALLEAGISKVCTLDGQLVQEGFVESDKLRPSLRGGKPVLFIVRENRHWQPLKLD
jgi:hypothetical protein